MILKLDFVTNSSSTTFIVAGFDKEFFKRKEVRKVIKYRKYFDTIEKLIMYIDDTKTCDWVSRITGPRNTFLKNDYKEIVKRIKQNKLVTKFSAHRYKTYIVEDLISNYLKEHKEAEVITRIS